jgi:hypothetical protein
MKNYYQFKTSVKSIITIALLIILSPKTGNAQTNFNWVGEVSSEWNNPLNWQPNSIPGSNATININDDGVNFPCILSSDQSISVLNVSVGFMNLDGFTLQVNNANLIGGVLQNGTISAVNINNLSNANLINITIRKTGGSNNDWAGGNNFTNFTFINQSTRRVRMALFNGDTFNGNTTISKNSSGQISLASAGNNVFNGNITINNAHNSNFMIGEAGGNIIINNGAILTNGFNTGTLNIANLVQTNALDNGTLNPVNFICSNVQFNGGVQVNATNITISTSSFSGNNAFTSANITLNNSNSFSTLSTSTVITKTGTGNNTWQGGNNFNNLTLNNNSTGAITLSNINEDNYFGNTIFNKNGTGTISIARSGASIFNGNLSINNYATGNFIFGSNGGSSLIKEGFSLITANFNTGNLTINNLVQEGSTPNGSFAPSQLTLTNCELGGAFEADVVGSITLNNTALKNSNTLTAASFALSNNNMLSSTTGTSIINKNGNTNNDWNGGNTFGNIIINNNSSARIMLAVNEGDTFLSDATFNKNSTGAFHIARRGENIFNGNVIINNESAGSLFFGDNGGNSRLINGALLTNAFTNGTLTINRFSQESNINNGNFSPQTFNALLTTFNGDIQINASNNITINQCTFAGNNQLTSNNIILSNANQLSTEANTTEITKTGGTEDIWTGGNTFGRLIVNNNSTQRIRLANAQGDTILNGLTINKNSTGDFLIARTGSNIINGNLILNCSSTGSIALGDAGGNTILNNGALLSNGYSLASLTINRLTQIHNHNNGSFEPINFNSTLTSLNGDISITATGTIILNQVDYKRSNTMTGDNILLQNANSLSTTAGATIITKTGGTEDSWTGGNTFGPLTINNNSNVRIRLAATNGDQFNGSFIANKNGTGEISFAANGQSIFNANAWLNTNIAGTIRTGEYGGSSLFVGNTAINTEGFENAQLILNNVIQEGTQDNGHFNVSNFFANNNTIGGGIYVNASTEIRTTNSSFTNTTVFIAPNIILTGAGQFATDNGAHFAVTKTGGGTNLWTGGNTFGTLVINQNSTSLLRLASSVGDTYAGNVTINKNGTGDISFAFNGTNVFQRDIILNANATGNIRIGESNGTSSQATGYSIKTNGFSAANLNINRFNQAGGANNDNFNPASFSALATQLRGDIQINATGNVTLNNTSLHANANITALNIFLNGSGNFASINNTSTSFTKTGGSDNFWNGGNTFGNITITNASSALIRTGSNSGDTYNGNAHFIKSASGQLQIAHNGSHFFRGNISTAGSNQSLTLAGGTGTVVINGSGIQQLNGNEGQAINIRRLNMNTSGQLLLNIPLNINVNANFNEGYIRSSNSNLITFLNTATRTGGGNNSHIHGPVRKIGNQSFSFPTGNGEIFKPIGISAPSNNTHHFTAEFFYDNSDLYYSHAQKAASLIDISTCGYWILNRTNGTSNVSVTLNHGRAACAAYDPATLKVARWNGTSWVDHGMGSFNADDVVSNGPITSFSPFAVAYEMQEALPVKMLDFSANMVGTEVHLYWKTASETNSSHFEIERSPDLVDFEKIGKVEAAYFSNTAKEYNLIDAQPLNGSSYYRLVQVDKDGKSEIYGPVMIHAKSNDADWSVYPNPFQDIININCKDCSDISEIHISDLHGKPLKRIQLNRKQQENSTFDLSDLSSGVYFVSIIQKGGICYKRIIKN